jgi:hypothetical protein
MNWIAEFIDQHKEFESPLSFWKWAALCSISAVVKDSVWMSHGAFMNTYPNIYVMLHADSGLKKSAPVNVAKKLVQIVDNTRVISGRSSIQGIMKAMSTAKALPGKPILKTACAFICSSELSASIVEDPQAMTILTDLYDRNYNAADYGSLLKQEQYDLNKPTVTMFSATNESHANEFFSQKEIGGGFFARTFIVFETEENRINSLTSAHTTTLDYNKLAEYLKTLSQLSGPFLPLSKKEPDEKYQIPIADPQTKLTSYYTEASAIYDQWYYNFRAEAKGVRDSTGTLNRMGTSVLKVAMLLSLGEKPELELTPSAVEEAIEICTKLVGNVRKITLGRGTQHDTSGGQRKILLLRELLDRESHSITRAMLHKKYWLQGSVSEWDDAVVSAKEAGLIEIVNLSGSLVYEMNPERVKELKEFLAGKGKSL